MRKRNLAGCFLLGLAIVGCPNGMNVRTASDVRDELCAMAPALPPTPELEYFETVCALSKPLSEVAAAFERCPTR